MPEVKKKKLDMGVYIAPVVIPVMLTLSAFLSIKFSTAFSAAILAVIPSASLGLATVLGVGLSLVCAVLVGVVVCLALSAIVNRLWLGTSYDRELHRTCKKDSFTYVEKICQDLKDNGYDDNACNDMLGKVEKDGKTSDSSELEPTRAALLTALILDYQAAQKNNELYQPRYQIVCREKRKQYVRRLKHENRREYSLWGNSGSCFHHIVSGFRFGFDKESKKSAKDTLPRQLPPKKS